MSVPNAGRTRNPLLRLWFDRPFAVQMMLSFLMVTILSTLVLYVINYRYMEGMFERKIADLVTTNLGQAVKSTQSALAQYDSAVTQFLYSQDFENEVVRFQDEDELTRTIAQQSMHSRIIGFVRYMEAINTAAFQATDGSVTMYSRDLESGTVSKALEERTEDLFATRGQGGHWSSARAWESAGGARSHFFIYRRELRDYLQGSILGSFAIGVEEAVLEDICATSLITADYATNFVFIADEWGTILSHYDKELIGKSYTRLFDRAPQGGSGVYESVLDGERVLVAYRRMEDPDWQMFYVLHGSYITDELRFFRTVSYAVCGIFALVAVALSGLLTRAMSRSVTQIVGAMESAGTGDMEVRVRATSREFAAIARGFNRMIRTISGLMDDLRRQTRMVQEATGREKEAAIKMLEAQINPHFLYNTLDSINWIAIENEQAEISAMLKNLAEILRYSVDKSTSRTTVRSEMLYLEKYLDLQKFRFAEKFEYTLEADEEVLDCPIHKLLFQPLIENAIVHGFSDIDSGGRLDIRFEAEEGERIRVIVADNGRGMDDARRRRILHPDDSTPSIGVANVIARLEAYYPGHYTLDLRTGEGEGCVFDIRILRRPMEADRLEQEGAER